MAQRPKDIGTAAETAVLRYLQANGWPSARRYALHGALDVGDIDILNPDVVIEVKGGKAAENASDGQIEKWLAETQREVGAAGAKIGVLVMKRRGIGMGNAGLWRAVITLRTWYLLWGLDPQVAEGDLGTPMQFRLEAVAMLLRSAGYYSRVD
jgi:hypothetical protein